MKAKEIICLLFVGLLLYGGCANKKANTRIVPADVTEDFGANWQFHAGDGLDSNWHSAGYEDKHWLTVVSDKSLAEQNVTLKDGGWYRKKISLPEELQIAVRKAEAMVLDLGRFAACEEVYVNGHQIGKTGEFPHDYAGYFDHHRQYVIPLENLELNGENLIAVKFHDGWSANGGFMDGAVLKAKPARTLDKLDLHVEVSDDDYIFLGKDSIEIQPRIVNKNSQAVKGLLTVKLSTDDHRLIKEDSIEITIPPKSTFESRLFGLTDPTPGFYRYDITLHIGEGQQTNKKFNVGYDPEKIISPNDGASDFDAFWQQNLDELAKISPDYQLTHLPEQSGLDYEMYQVTMRSFENELISGYYAKPKKEGRHPVIVEYMGYGSSPYFPNQTWDGFAYFVLSIRGQALNKPTNRFGTWFTYGIDHQDTYYYRGAFLDVVRALDFVSSRPEIDSDRIAVRGSSQGGALSVVAASLDRRVKALAIGIPFLSDYRDYFNICSWPRSDVETYIQENPETTWEQVYRTLSYFDIKNLASRITVPAVMGIGVQDEVCPPHINFAVYNQIRSSKSWMAFAQYGHSTGKEFHEAGLDLFRKELRVGRE